MSQATFLRLILFVIIHFTSNSAIEIRSGQTNLQTICLLSAGGCLQGKVEQGIGRSYEAWLGVPYAKPPVGDLRFQDPVPPESLRSIYDATYVRDFCAQSVLGQFAGSEDCLYLNVFRPNTANRFELLPVLVFIHGGAFKGSSSDPLMYGPEYLMDTGEVVLVTFNYRLNVLGFLAADDESCKGNFGLKDQSMALEWVRNNIVPFGGDSQRITVMGQSSGAASVQYQMMSERSNGLFNRAILMSGSALAYWALKANPEVLFREYANVAGIDNAATEDTSEIVRQLREKTVQELIEFHSMIPTVSDIQTVFRPVVEGDWEGAFITEDPKVIWANGSYEQRPFLAGVTGYEEGSFAGLVVNEELRSEWMSNFRETIAKILEYPNSNELMDFILEAYFNGTVTQENSYNVLQFRDRIFDYPLYQTVRDYLRIGDSDKNPVQTYLFNFTSSFSTAMLTGPYPFAARGPSHSDDLLYLFPWKVLDQSFQRGEAENEMKDFLVRFIVDYVTGREGDERESFGCDADAMEQGSCLYLDIQRDYNVTPNTVTVAEKRSLVNLQMVERIQEIDRIIESS